MGNRGRTSGAELAVVTPIGLAKRPEPPADLSEDEAAEWLAIVNRLPADWFQRETHSLLTQYCRSVIELRNISHLLEALRKSQDFTIKTYDKLLRAKARESGLIATLATKMRICQSATYDKSRKKPIEPESKLWE